MQRVERKALWIRNLEKFYRLVDERKAASEWNKNSQPKAPVMGSYLLIIRLFLQDSCLEIQVSLFVWIAAHVGRRLPFFPGRFVLSNATSSPLHERAQFNARSCRLSRRWHPFVWSWCRDSKKGLDSFIQTEARSWMQRGILNLKPVC